MTGARNTHVVTHGLRGKCRGEKRLDKRKQNNNSKRRNQGGLGTRQVVLAQTRIPGFSALTALTPFPARLRTHLTYQDVVTTTSDGTTASTSGTSVLFNLNSLFLIRGAGHQPYAYDTFATLYRRYIVYGVHISITAQGSGNGTVYAGCMFLPGGAAAQLNAITSFSQKIGEKPLARLMLLVAASGRVGQEFECDVDLASLEGLTREEYSANSNYRALMTASPSITPQFEVANAGNATSEPCVWRIRMTFDVELYERIILAQSS